MEVIVGVETKVRAMFKGKKLVIDIMVAIIINANRRVVLTDKTEVEIIHSITVNDNHRVVVTDNLEEEIILTGAMDL